MQRSNTTSFPGLAFVILAALLFIVSCSDSDDPTEPTTLNVAGLWKFAGTVTENSCGLNVTQNLATEGGGITFRQEGSAVSADILVPVAGQGLTFQYSGMVTGNNVSMTATNTENWQDGTTSITFSSILTIQNIQENTGNGTVELPGTCTQGCTNTCQIIWTGTWTKQ